MGWRDPSLPYLGIYTVVRSMVSWGGKKSALSKLGFCGDMDK